MLLAVITTFLYIFLFDLQPILVTCRIGNVLSMAYLLRWYPISISQFYLSPPFRLQFVNECDQLTRPKKRLSAYRKGLFQYLCIPSVWGYFKDLSILLIPIIDCIFSGHMTLLTVFSLYWLSYGLVPLPLSKLGKLCRSITFSCFLCGGWVILANRAHYTVDLAIAVYTCAGIWWSYAYFWQEYVEKSNCLVHFRQYYNPILTF